MKKKLTEELLKESGWHSIGGLMVLKERVRFGWDPKTKECIAGYTTVPFNVEYVYQMRRLLKAFNIKTKLRYGIFRRLF